MNFRRKAARAVSRGSAEPTDSPVFGGIIDPAVLREIDATNPTSWLRARPERDGLDANEENFPEAAAAGRELAKGAYARRLREARPIPREKTQGAKVAGAEGIHLMNEITLVVRDHVQKGDVTATELDLKGPMQVCVATYAATLMHLFSEHWS